MPTYNFICEACESPLIEFEQPMTIPLPTRCPFCNETNEDKFHQIYNGDNFVFCRGEPTTFGQQAERNAKRVGREQIEAMVEQSKVANHKGKRAFTLPSGGTPTNERYKATRPWWRPDSDKPLDITRIKDKNAFVLEGKTS